MHLVPLTFLKQMCQGNSNSFPPEQAPALATAIASVIGVHPGTPILSQLRAVCCCYPYRLSCRTEIYDPGWGYAGLYVGPVKDGTEYCFIEGGHTLASPKGGRPCPLGTLNYEVVWASSILITQYGGKDPGDRHWVLSQNVFIPVQVKCKKEQQHNSFYVK